MNKRDAKKLSEAGILTFGELREAIRMHRPRDGFSVVNRTINLQKALDIYEKIIMDRPVDEKVIGFKMSYGQMRRTLDSIMAYNIIRDCM